MVNRPQGEPRPSVLNTVAILNTSWLELFLWIEIRFGEWTFCGLECQNEICPHALAHENMNKRPKLPVSVSNFLANLSISVLINSPHHMLYSSSHQLFFLSDFSVFTRGFGAHGELVLYLTCTCGGCSCKCCHAFLCTAGQLNKASENQQEFQMRGEDFPALPGSSTKNAGEYVYLKLFFCLGPRASYSKDKRCYEVAVFYQQSQLICHKTVDFLWVYFCVVLWTLYL